jgi:hypothetical protein
LTGAVELRVEPLQRGILDGVEDPDEEGRRLVVDVGIIPWFLDERPLHGLAGYIDWRSSGMLTALIRRGFCRGAADESVLLPARLGLPVARLVLVGFGDARTFGRTEAMDAAARAVRIANRLRPRDVLFAMPGWLQERDLVESVFTGLTQALRRGDGRTGPSPLELAELADRGASALPQRWWVVTDPRHVARLRRLLEGPPRAAAES